MNHIIASVPIEDRCPRNQPDGAHAFKRGAFVDSPIRCRYCGVKQQAAGDPAPTNPTTVSRRDELAAVLKLRGLHTSEIDALINAHRAEVLAAERPILRIEILAEVADLLRDAEETTAALLVNRLLEGGDER